MITTLPWTLELPANGGSPGATDFQLVVDPPLTHVVGIEVSRWAISASSMPPRVKIQFGTELGSSSASGFYSLAVVSGTGGNPTITLNRAFMFTPNPTLQFDSRELDSPVAILSGPATEGIRGLSLRVTDFNNQPISWSGYIVLELRCYIDNSLKSYNVPLNAMQRRVMDGYYITDGKRPKN